MRKALYLIIYLVCVPLFGLLFGFIFFSLFDYINGPLNEIALEISLIVWGVSGLIAGIYGAFMFLKIDKLNKFKGRIGKLE